ncbi:DUF692 domain-containing protein [Motilimonas sp. 1_MG-2023]|uniref:MNIO family bufferin maturase n=1 Tax=Motilimonas sp. 1_MG-2023 TaxID=3062672 RepID=UPI0026E3EB95|nr:DUF692 domain-containing protein [Motilimonas sp. 1_MG-2023]MDO6525900.1 DUF692 domain-containing protein [Motilimonas sp. 1_MG-2023]
MSLAKLTGGVGIGLRHPHFKSILESKPDLAFLEVHSENYFNPHGQSRYFLDQLMQQYPISCHGIGLSLGSADPLSASHLAQLKDLVDHCQPVLISEHLSWGSINGQFFNDLLPLPYTQELLNHFSTRVEQVQHVLGRQILIENPSSYLRFNQSVMPEWELLNRLVDQTGCGLLLDLNNIYVSSMNLGFRCSEYLAEINTAAVQEIHLAGFTRKVLSEGEILIDTHGSRVSDPVWGLYQNYLEANPAVATLIEWDTDIPPLSVLLEEQQKALAYG